MVRWMPGANRLRSSMLEIDCAQSTPLIGALKLLGQSNARLIVSPSRRCFLLSQSMLDPSWRRPAVVFPLRAFSALLGPVIERYNVCSPTALVGSPPN
jgi:hypothetical protein